MARLTRKKDQFPCRLGRADTQACEDFITSATGCKVMDIVDDFCQFCPFEKYINKLAKYEDMEECVEDDLK